MERINRSPYDSPHKGSVISKAFACHDVSQSKTTRFQETVAPYDILLKQSRTQSSCAIISIFCFCYVFYFGKVHVNSSILFGITVYPKKYAHGFCFAVLCCGYTLTDFPISIRLTSLALWQSNDCPSASKATLMNMDKYFMWIHYERLHNHNKAKHSKTVCIFLGIYCISLVMGNHTIP